MSLRRLKSKVKEASGTLEALLCEGGRASKSDRVLVVYDGGAASIYYENESGADGKQATDPAGSDPAKEK